MVDNMPEYILNAVSEINNKIMDELKPIQCPMKRCKLYLLAQVCVMESLSGNENDEIGKMLCKQMVMYEKQ